MISMHRTASRFASGLLGMLVAIGIVVPAHAAWYWPFGADTVAYKVELNGVDADAFAWLKELKLDEINRDTDDLEDAATGETLTEREVLDRELVARGGRVRQAMEAIGYYDSSVQQSLREGGEKPVLVYDVRPGPRYTVGRIVFDWQGGEALKQLATTGRNTKVGEPVNARSILRDAIAVLDEAGERACVLRLTVDPVVRIYDSRGLGRNPRADVVFTIKRGAVADFGPTEISGNVNVKDAVVLRSVSWREGRCYRQSRVDDTQTKLVETQLFSTVSITHPAMPDASGQVPMRIHVTERAARTLRAGASYSSDNGVMVTSGWEHRNLWGGAEKLNVNAAIGQEEMSLKNTLRLPSFGDDRQTLVLTGNIKREDTDAYVADTIEGGVTLERKLMRGLKGGVGVGYSLTQTEDEVSGESQYGLLSFPTFLEYDSRNNVLDPKRGILANLTVTPYTETFGDGGQFVKTQFSGQTYVSAPIMLSPTLAMKVAVGSIMGAKGEDVPSDVRFYAGGGGSVRGYGYQTLGPRVNNSPSGGSSFVAGSVEGRLRFTEEFGGVVFADAGNAYKESVPESGEKLYTSVGIGMRYYTAIGPIRADIAVPLNGQDVDASKYALYISIGQAF